MILDLRTLMIVMIATSLLLAVSLMVAVGPHFRDGLGKWTAALLTEATVFALYSLRGVWPDFFSIVLANALFVTCLTLQAAAIREFYGKPLAVWWHVLPALLVAALFILFLENFQVRVVLSGLVMGIGMLILAITGQRLHHKAGGTARWLLLAGYLIGASAMLARVVAGVLETGAIQGFMIPSALQGFTFLSGIAAVLVTSVGFLLLHKERSEQVAQKLALIDPLTGAFNRRTFLELAEKEIARTRRARGSLSLIMLDLDHFKKINDRNGHLAGDKVLKETVSVVLTCLRREDLLVRYGGEEFCILLPTVAIDSATFMAERVRVAIGKKDFMFDGRKLKVTASMGLATLSLDGNEDVDTLVSRADEALYTAKKAGRNRVVVFTTNSTAGLRIARR